MPKPDKKRGRPNADDSIQRHIGATVRKYRLQAGLEQKDVAERLGYTASAVGNWELGITRPDITVISRLCTILRIPPHELLLMNDDIVLPREEQHVLDVYHAMDRLGRREILRHAEQLLSDQEKRERALLRRQYAHLPMPVAVSPAAGGSVPMPDESDVENVYLINSEGAQNSDWIMRVNGESMAPDYPDQARIFISTKLEVSMGEVGVFIVDGECYIKERRENCLRSLNCAYPDIPITDFSDVRLFGKVVGVCPEEAILTGDMLDKVREAFEMEAEDEGE